MEVNANRFAANASRALGEAELQGSLSAATGRLSQARHDAFADFPAGDALRDRAREIKRRTIEELDLHLDRLASSVETHGGVVHWARDAAEARQIVLAIVAERDGRIAVKSKSMTNEEIGLNDALVAAGVEPVETDLGEYIIQIAGDTPSHIIVPAVHKTKDQISDLFEKKHQTERKAKREELTQEARGLLRAKFLEADVGITGANFAVAETGTIAIVENEGNARLSTTLPRCHIAVMGMEKVVPDMESLAVFLRILARSATGQKMSSYVSLLTGPRRDGEEDGPDEFHLVILDNGRTAILADPALREALYCIRCGACLNVCPVYRHAGGHAYGWVYPGPIGAVVTPSLVGHAAAAPSPFASSLCGACKEVCPVRIDLPRLLLAQRERVVDGVGGRALERALLRSFGWLVRSPARYRAISRVARWLSPLIPRNRKGIPLLSAWTASRDLPALARESFRERWKETRGDD